MSLYPIKGLEQKSLVLASQSPRRKMLFEGLGLAFSIRVKEIDESFPANLTGGDIPLYLAEKKATAMDSSIAPDEILITADTIVWINGRALNKPASLDEARAMLKELSGATHSVFTGVCMRSTSFSHSFAEETKVTFNDLSTSEIDYYLENYAPFDKAGAYGIQEFIGLIGIKQITGDFYNVVGFPMQRFWRELKTLLS